MKNGNHVCDYERGAGRGFLDPEKREYHILVENETDWTVEKKRLEETFRAVSGQTTISVNGKEVPYNQYLVSMGATVDVEAEQEETRSWKFCKICSSGISWSEPDSSGMVEQKKNRFRFWNGRSGSRYALPKHISSLLMKM